MNLVAILTIAASAAVAGEPVPQSAADTALPRGVVDLAGRPHRVQVLDRGGEIDVLLAEGRDVERFRLQGRTLVRTGRFQAPVKGLRPLFLDAAPAAAGGDPVVTVVFAEDLRSVDQGVDTVLHSWVLSATQDGGLQRASDDLRGWLRIVGGAIFVQPRGHEALAAGPVRRVEKTSSGHAAGAEVPWGGRWLLEATPLPGGTEALAWSGERPQVVTLERGTNVPGGTTLSELGKIGEPTMALRIDRPLIRGIDREGDPRDDWRPLPRRVSVAGDGGAYTVARGRSARFWKTAGLDAVVRLDWSDGALTVSRPYPGVEAFVIDFALLSRGKHPAAVVLANEKDDGKGRAYLVFQEVREDRAP